MVSVRYSATKFMPLLLPVALVGIWWIASINSASIYFPPLPRVLSVLYDDWWSSRLTDDLIPSLVNLFSALAIAIIIAVAAGAAIGSSEIFYRAMLPILDVMRSCPGVALVPVFLAIFGIGDVSEVAVITFAALWPMLLNIVDGVRLSMVTYTDIRHNLRMSYGQRLRYVDIPASLPQLMAGLYTSLAIGIVVMVVSEFYSSTRGIGFYLASAEQTFSIARTYAGVILLGIAGYVLSIMLRRLERVVLRWQNVGGR